MPDADGTGGGAPAGFTAFNGHYYKYVKGLFNYHEAQAGAAAQGGHLATITSTAENAFLAGLIAGQDLGAWLGGSDSATEGVWKWTDGADAGTTFWTGLGDGGAPAGQYANWSVGEPNGIWNGIEEDHFHMMANSDKWNDASGQWATMGYFVEIDGAGGPPPPPPPANAPPVITSNGGGAAATLTLEENTRAVTTVTATDADDDTLVFDISGGADAALFAIDADSGALSFRAAPDFEAPADAGADNVYDVVVRVRDAVGSDTQALAVSVTNVAENTGGAPAGFTAFNGHYYKYVKGLFSYYEAQAGAAAQGGHLATITSTAENAFLAGLIAGQDLGAWLGGSDSATEGVWKWTEGADAGTTFWTGLGDGSAPVGSYANWSVGEPGGIWNGIEEDHFHMMANSDKWNDASGQWASMGYFVEIDGAGGPPPPPPANAPPVITSNGGGAAAALTLEENTRAVTTVTATDADDDTLVFDISGGADAALFAIDADSGALSFRAAPDFEAPVDAGADNVYDVVVRVRDAGGSDTQALAVSVTNVAENTGGAPAGFTAFNGHYYKYVSGYFTRAQASANAASDGGHLATITSAAENAFLADLMAAGNPAGYGGWLGGSDAATEGVWKWTEGPEAGETFWNGLSGGSAPAGQYTHWLPGEPSQYQGTEEDYLHMLTGTDQWNDIPDQYWLTMGYFVEISA